MASVYAVGSNLPVPSVIGSTNTPLVDSMDEYTGGKADSFGPQIQQRKADPVEIGKLIAFLLSDEAAFITGSTYRIDGGWLT